MESSVVYTICSNTYDRYRTIRQFIESSIKELSEKLSSIALPFEYKYIGYNLYPKPVYMYMTLKYKILILH